MKVYQPIQERHIIIHDFNLKRWAFEAQEELQIPNFYATLRWIQKFKQNRNKVFRKDKVLNLKRSN